MKPGDSACGLVHSAGVMWGWYRQCVCPALLAPNSAFIWRLAGAHSPPKSIKAGLVAALSWEWDALKQVQSGPS